ncbi:YfhO family protein [Pseudoflavitalea sp. G-6-1-2]|uniref:hypothetical protein n=1 Tax=Pseudoflavitalea sp. G-6-1-2 TaxID=2728841 RepID=UPI00146A9815|nr:hypothetical protein [Pseudoflavitalea sp. G-6-1-2]NML23315.1 YfhO family protein [Pseudoflavitalea sp. G-6-1-2]
MSNGFPNASFRQYWLYLYAEIKEEDDGFFRKIWKGLRILGKLTSEVLWDAWLELLFLALFWLVIAKMGQGRDLIVSLFEPDGLYTEVRIFFTIVTVIFYSMSMWIIPAVFFQQKDDYADNKPNYESSFHKHLFFAHRILPLIPFWLMSTVLFRQAYADWIFAGFALIEIVILTLFKGSEYEPRKKEGRDLQAVEKKRRTGRKWLMIIVIVLLAVSLVWFAIIYQKKYTEAKRVFALILYLISFLMYFFYNRKDSQLIAVVKEHAGQEPKPKTKRYNWWATVKTYKANSLFFAGYLIIQLAIVVYIFKWRPNIDFAPESLLLFLFSFYVLIIDLFFYFINVSNARRFVAGFVFVILVVLYNSSAGINLNLRHYKLDPNPESSLVNQYERLDFQHRYEMLRDSINNRDSIAPYPIILVSGEGGGSRAGMWFSENLIAFDYLTKGKFRDHIFSVSTVSGSSIGLGTVMAFWEQPMKGDSIDKRWLNLPAKVFCNNFVGSSITGSLLTDLWKTFIPVDLSTHDRNNILQDEEAFFTQKALMEVTQEISTGSDQEIKLPRNIQIPANERILAHDFMSFFYEKDPYHNGIRFRAHMPLVFVNTCRSNDGRRGIFSPIRLSGDYFNDAVDITAYLYDKDVYDEAGNKIPAFRKRNISLGQACNTSELFPVFSASAYIDSLGNFVDGGYHENSGLKTTLDVYRKLSEQLANDTKIKKGSYKIYILYLKNGETDRDLYKSQRAEPPLLSPVKAFFNQPFTGSAAYFEEKARHIGLDSSVEFVNIALSNRVALDTSITSQRSKKVGLELEKEMLNDLVMEIDTSKKQMELNFPLARWLSHAVIRRIRMSAQIPLTNNPKLMQLLGAVNAIYIRKSQENHFQELQPMQIEINSDTLLPLPDRAVPAN